MLYGPHDQPNKNKLNECIDCQSFTHWAKEAFTLKKPNKTAQHCFSHLTTSPVLLTIVPQFLQVQLSPNTHNKQVSNISLENKKQNSKIIKLPSLKFPLC